MIKVYCLEHNVQGIETSRTDIWKFWKVQVFSKNAKSFIIFLLFLCAVVFILKVKVFKV